MIHVAITRVVRPGQEQAFEQRLREFFRDAEAARPDSRAYLLRPLGAGRDYGILRSFPDEAAREAFYASDLYRAWSAEVEPLVEGAPERRELHGLEAFFRGADAPPPTWKMALLTWLAVDVAVYVFSHAVPLLVPPLPGPGTFLLVNACVVAALAWVLMPLLTRAARPWLVA